MGVTSGPSGARRLMATASMIAVAAVALAACSSSPAGSSSSSTSTTSSSHGSSSTTAGGGSSTTSAGSSTAAELSQFEANVQSAQTGTFDLTYAETSSTEKSSTLTFEQLPPKYRFSVGGAVSSDVINTGTGTYACSGESGHEYCYNFSAASNVFAPLLGVITGKSVLTTLHSVQAGLEARAHGVQLSFSTQTFAGQPSRCASGTYQGNSFKYSATDSGVLAYAGGSGSKGYGSLTLTSYSTTAPASDFALPAGATVVTS